MTISRSHLALGAAGLVAGLALGLTGLAQAGSPGPSPAPGRTMQDRMQDHRGMPFGDRKGGHHPGRYGGLVTAVDSDSLTVRGPRGTETVALTSSTAYYDGATKATRSVLDAGDVVHVRLVDPRATSKVAAVVTVVPARIAGWVTQVGDTSLTLKDLDGFTRTVRTGSGTTYVKDGATATRSAITVGSLVRAVGHVADDGTTLEATRVATGMPSREDGPGPDGPGFGRGGMMDGPTA